MSFHDRLRDIATAESQEALEAAGSAYTKAPADVAQQQEMQNRAKRIARTAAKAVLRQLCESEDVPMSERAAWSAAFRCEAGQAEFTPGAFAQRAENYSIRLAEIDAQLREPGVPILGFKVGLSGVTGSHDPHEMRYAYRVGDGSGLTYAQHYNNMQALHCHYAAAGEWPLPGKLSTLDGERNRPLIFKHPNDLVEAVATPEEAADMLRFSPSRPTDVFIIGGQAISAMFEAVGSNPRSDPLLGHAVYLGFRPEF